MNDNAWRLERDNDGIVNLIIDRPGSSVNSLSQSVLLELETLLRELKAAPPRGVMIRSGKASGFIAGADIREFTTFRDAADAFEHIRIGQRVFDQLEALPCPTVAAIASFALGGGLELALACRYRVAVNDSRLAMGLPEVLLGIHPGFGGTVRAVRLLGVRQAMELMLTGKPLRADRVLHCGLVDRLVPATDLERVAREILIERPAKDARITIFSARWPTACSACRECGSFCAALWRHGSRARHGANTIRRLTPSSTCGCVTVRVVARPSMPRRTRSHGCSLPRPPAVWCGCFCCRID